MRFGTLRPPPPLEVPFGRGQSACRLSQRSAGKIAAALAAETAPPNYRGLGHWIDQQLARGDMLVEFTAAWHDAIRERGSPSLAGFPEYDYLPGPAHQLR